MSNRRSFLKASLLMGLSATAKTLVNQQQLQTLESVGSWMDNKFVLPELPYTYEALEPFIDAKTMTLHHSKHHQAYVDKLNAALVNFKSNKTLNELLSEALKLGDAIRNNAGGHFNHSFFWQCMRAPLKGAENMPGERLNAAIKEKYGTLDAFKKEFTKASMSVFGSGWCWLVKKDEKLDLLITPNQDNPLMFSETSEVKLILGLDVWEHAYYLNYLNKRTDYISAWWNVVNWDFAETQWKHS